MRGSEFGDLLILIIVFQKQLAVRCRLLGQDRKRWILLHTLRIAHDIRHVNGKSTDKHGQAQYNTVGKGNTAEFAAITLENGLMVEPRTPIPAPIRMMVIPVLAS